LSVLGKIVLMDMVETLEWREEEVLRRNQRGTIISKTRGDDRG
jgi:hypothetical protein